MSDTSIIVREAESLQTVAGSFGGIADSRMRERVEWLVSNIVETTHQPFIQLGILSPSNTEFLNCKTQQNVGEFVDVVEKSSIFASSSFLKFLCLSFRMDFYGASECVLDWLEKGSSEPTVQILDLEREGHSLPYVLEFPAFVIDDVKATPGSPSTVESAAERAEALSRAVHMYDATTGNDFYRWCLIEGSALGLARYFASTGLPDTALGLVEIALKYAPKSIHLRASQHALNLTLSSKPVPPRLVKFIGRDNGALKSRICAEPFKRFDISPSGEVLVCCGHWVPKPIGNLMTDEVADIMNSPSAYEIRASMLDGSYKFCNHLECNALINDSLPVKEKVVDAGLRRAIDQNDLHVDQVSQVLFAFDQSCNLSCPSCRKSVIVEKPSLNEAKADVVANKLMPLLSGLRKLDINPAGEVFFSKPSRRILEMVSKETSPDLKIDLISNGMLFSEKEWAKFPNLPGLVRSVRISTDAARKGTFEKLRRLGVWEPFVKNMRFLSKLRSTGEIAQFKLSFTYQVDNYQEMREFVLFVQELEADFAIFERLQNLGAFTWEEFKSKAVHLSDHPDHELFLDKVRDPIFGNPRVWHDFEWEGVARCTSSYYEVESNSGSEVRESPREASITQFVGA